MDRPAVVAFDVNETLSDLEPLRDRFREVGLPAELSATWFAGVLRDGFALTAVGRSAPFAEIAGAVLRGHLHGRPDVGNPEDVVPRVLEAFQDLAVHPDVPAGVRALRDGGLRLVTLSNGSAEIAERLLATAGLQDAFEHVLSVQPSGVWKPAAQAYAEATRATGVPPEQMMLVAVHPWDIDGAHRAGLRTAWVDRRGGSPYPDHFSRPDLVVSGIEDLAGRLG